MGRINAFFFAFMTGLSIAHAEVCFQGVYEFGPQDFQFEFRQANPGENGQLKTQLKTNDAIKPFTVDPVPMIEISTRRQGPDTEVRFESQDGHSWAYYGGYSFHLGDSYGGYSKQKKIIKSDLCK